MIYVNMTDSFMSGWGRARNGPSYYCIQCDTREQADAVLKAAEDRPEMKRIAVNDKPRKKSGAHTSIRHVSKLGRHWLAYMDAEMRADLEKQAV